MSKIDFEVFLNKFKKALILSQNIEVLESL